MFHVRTRASVRSRPTYRSFGHVRPSTPDCRGRYRRLPADVPPVQGSPAAWQDVRPFGANAVVELRARARHDREGVAPVPRPAGVDDNAGVARIVVTIRHRIERRAPAAAQ